MTIKIDVKKPTFEKSLVKIGFNYQIKQFDDLIASIKRNIIFSLKEAMNNGTLIEKTL